jgi:outer membrane protein assembly factor BamB
LNIDTQRLLWKNELGSAINSSPCVYNGKVYVGCDDHYLYCLDAADKNLNISGNVNNSSISEDSLSYDAVKRPNLSKDYSKRAPAKN